MENQVAPQAVAPEKPKAPEAIMYKMSASPHIARGLTSKKIMFFVIFALLPALVFGAFTFGLYALFVVLLCVASCVASEWLFCVATKQPSTVGDLSAVVTGLILGLCLPPLVPFYVPIVGGVFAIVIVKMLFGGLGKNFANPAATARVFLLLAWTGLMTSNFIEPIINSNYFATSLGQFSYIFTGASGSGSAVDVLSGATPLGGGDTSLLALFFGFRSGSIGETSIISILIGAIFLFATGVIKWEIPVSVLASVAVFAFLFGGFDPMASLEALMTGGVMFGAVFMATDYATSPNTRVGQLVYGAFIGFACMFLRSFSNMPEGMSYAIILGNVVTPLFDKYIVPKPFGYVKPKKPSKTEVTVK